jgi:hypothetical protein
MVPNARQGSPYIISSRGDIGPLPQTLLQRFPTCDSPLRLPAHPAGLHRLSCRGGRECFPFSRQAIQTILQPEPNDLAGSLSSLHRRFRVFEQKRIAILVCWAIVGMTSPIAVIEAMTRATRLHRHDQHNRTNRADDVGQSASMAAIQFSFLPRGKYRQQMVSSRIVCLAD